MKLQVSAGLLIKDIQKEFRNTFPYLKLGFFKNQTRSAQIDLTQNMMPDTDFLIDITGTVNDGEIEILQDHAIAEVKQLFKNSCGLPVHIFRKKGFSWTETTMTDNLTLRKQNEMGEESLYPIVVG